MWESDHQSSIKSEGGSPNSQNRTLILAASISAGIFCLGVSALGVAIFFFAKMMPRVSETIPSFPELATFTPAPVTTLTTEATATREALRAQSLATEAVRWPLAFSDSFSRDSSLWNTEQYVSERWEGKREIKDEKYRISAKALKSFAAHEFPDTTHYPEISTITDFYFAADTYQISGSESGRYGIAFRYNAGNYYFFSISNSGRFYLWVYYKNKWNSLIEGIKSSAIRPQAKNRLAVIAQGTHFDLFINGQYVEGIDDDRIREGETGLAFDLGKAGDEAVFVFDNVELRTPSILYLSPITPRPVKETPHPGATAIPPVSEHNIFPSNRDEKREN